MAKDLKVISRKPKTETYSGTPTAEGMRLIVASCDTTKGDRLSSSDFDTAMGLQKRVNNTEGLKVSSDADFAGMWSITNGKEKRSRSGIIITYNGMPISWRSSYQACKGSELALSEAKCRQITQEYAEDPNLDITQISTSSGEAEVVAAADAAKLAIHFKHVCEEIEIPIQTPVVITIDASAAEGFITNTETIGKMKHIDLRQHWVQIMRNRNDIKFDRKPGPENEADFFTKIIVGEEHQQAVGRLMSHINQETHLGQGGVVN